MIPVTKNPHQTMRTRGFPSAAIAALVLITVSGSCPSPMKAAEPPAQAVRRAVFDVTADAGRQLAEALTQAQVEQKHVLLMFGANWCPWCRRLHELFETGPQISAQLKRNYILVLVDVDKGRNSALVDKYDKPTQYGLPVIVVLDAEGRKLTTQDTSKLEAGEHYDPDKVRAFLRQASPTEGTHRSG